MFLSILRVSGNRGSRLPRRFHGFLIKLRGLLASARTSIRQPFLCWHDLQHSFSFRNSESVSKGKGAKWKSRQHLWRHTDKFGYQPGRNFPSYLSQSSYTSQTITPFPESSRIPFLLKVQSLQCRAWISLHRHFPRRIDWIRQHQTLSVSSVDSMHAGKS
ncbi:hypothetical protein BDD12DRAFT_547261 [Trichophaea hybrida]|nr:hypothetical protein BDD12DRAFT_547261 [Trichophaea hybrida]